ncbi:cbb3-type cytochrome oxidase assembly protein CcoS [Pseudovibrio sp. Tun.PSC04-5.I4]|uniref:cbb3-type cytochrome oxidase assembly protein CcoS n=1 Tax=Pseudovibrio sp. Tun.PSC04-5.I4 TaxID=1798213 RepID=UPI00088092EB|nr:cbb3-type cytochrome oxidase assembly protein CcoS [Pseudovibrio sp. Tun.PSC04-5.I4]SDQ84973.1 cytochrome oxidase maturation protein, cbb3-type [Pseudovibrio sp. Tun.PSC04-5.I4]
MEVLIYLIPIALVLGGAGLIAFLWSLKSGQYDDMEGPKWRILDDGDLQENSAPVKAEQRKVS